jgi:fatty-acid desaturase
MSAFLNYYGADWAAMALSLTAVYLLGNQARIGFLVFALANVVWVFLGTFWMNSLGIAIGNTAFLVMNLRGYLRWTAKPKPQKTPAMAQ